LIELTDVKTVRELRELLERCPDDWPVRTGDHAMAELYRIEAGELKVASESVLAIFPIENEVTNE
jgi:hypothetical protein